MVRCLIITIYCWHHDSWCQQRWWFEKVDDCSSDERSWLSTTRRSCLSHLHGLKTSATINSTSYKTKEKTKTTNVFSATALFIPASFKRIDCSCWLNSVEWLWNWILTQFSPQKHDLRQAHIGICDSGTRLAVHCVGWQIFLNNLTLTSQIQIKHLGFVHFPHHDTKVFD